MKEDKNRKTRPTGVAGHRAQAPWWRGVGWRGGRYSCLEGGGCRLPDDLERDDVVAEEVVHEPGASRDPSRTGRSPPPPASGGGVATAWIQGWPLVHLGKSEPFLEIELGVAAVLHVPGRTEGGH